MMEFIEFRSIRAVYVNQYDKYPNPADSRVITQFHIVNIPLVELGNASPGNQRPGRRGPDLPLCGAWDEATLLNTRFPLLFLGMHHKLSLYAIVFLLSMNEYASRIGNVEFCSYEKKTTT